MNRLFKSPGKNLLATLSTEMLDCNESFSVPLDQGRGHFVFTGSKWQRSWSPKQAGCDNCTMDEFSLGWTLETGNWPRFFVYCYSNYQIFPAPRIPGPKFYLETAQTYFEDVMIIILCVFSSAHLAPDRRNGLKRGRSRSQTPAQLCWARMFRYLGHDTNKQGLDSKGSGSQFSTIHARGGIMQLDLLGIAVLLELQLCVTGVPQDRPVHRLHAQVTQSHSWWTPIYSWKSSPQYSHA